MSRVDCDSLKVYHKSSHTEVICLCPVRVSGVLLNLTNSKFVSHMDKEFSEYGSQLQLEVIGHDFTQ